MKAKLNSSLLMLIITLVALQSVALEPAIGINTDTYAVTRNLKDNLGPPNARIHEYKVGGDGQVYWKREGEAQWSLFPKQPVDVYNTPWRVENLAADNNRIFVLARERDKNGFIVNSQLYWFCVYEDKAAWVESLLRDTVESAFMRGIVNAAQHFLETPINEDAYLIWVGDSHKGIVLNEGGEDALGNWETIYQLPDEGTSLNPNRARDNQPNLNYVIDLAVGHWNSTVVTYYVFSIDPNTGEKKIYYIDEEPMMREWRDISTKNHTYAMDEIEADPANVLANLIEEHRDFISVTFGDGWRTEGRDVELPAAFGAWIVGQADTRDCMINSLPFNDRDFWGGQTKWFTYEEIIVGFLRAYNTEACQDALSNLEDDTVSNILEDAILGGIGEVDPVPDDISDFVIEQALGLEGILPFQFIDFLVEGWDLDVTIPSQLDQDLTLLAAASVFVYAQNHDGKSGPEYPVGNSPLNQLTHCSRINASNSVIGVSVPDPAANETAIYYIRFDYHHQPDFEAFPLLDWSEDAWNVVHLGQLTKEFGINTHGQYDPRNYDPVNDPDGGGWWYIPPIQVYNKQMYIEGWEGFLGSYPTSMVANYPVSIATWGEEDSIELYASSALDRESLGVVYYYLLDFIPSLPSEFYPDGAPGETDVFTAYGTWSVTYIDKIGPSLPDFVETRLPPLDTWHHYQGWDTYRDKGINGDLLFVEPGNNAYSIHVNPSTGARFGGAGGGEWISAGGFGDNLDRYFTGDFDGDDLTDLGFLGDDHSFHVTLSTGTSFGAPGSDIWIDPSESGWGHVGGKYHTGDFNGDGMDDLLFIEPAYDTIHVAYSTGFSFAGDINTWATIDGIRDFMEYTFTGDFDGDGATDFGYIKDDNHFRVRLSTWSGFEDVAGEDDDRWFPRSMWGHLNGRFYVGDFDGDGDDDLMFFEPGPVPEPYCVPDPDDELDNCENIIYVALSTGSEFDGGTSGPWLESNHFGSLKDNYFVGDFNDDDMMDLGYLEANNGFNVSISSGFNFYGVGGGKEWIEHPNEGDPANPYDDALGWGHTAGRFLVGKFADRAKICAPPQYCIEDFQCASGHCYGGACVGEWEIHPSPPPGPGGPNGDQVDIPMNTRTTVTVDGTQELVLGQLDFNGWTPSTIVMGIGQTEGQSLDGVFAGVNGGAPVALSGYWYQIPIPFTGQSVIELTLDSDIPKNVEIQWWAQ